MAVDSEIDNLVCSLDIKCKVLLASISVYQAFLNAFIYMQLLLFWGVILCGELRYFLILRIIAA